MSGAIHIRELPVTEMYIRVEYWKNITDTGERPINSF